MEQTAADYAGISQPTLANILPAVCDAILRQLDEVIYMPRTNEERLQKKTSFARLGNFPRCIGAIDCTHVRIISPGGDIVRTYLLLYKDLFFVDFVIIYRVKLFEIAMDIFQSMYKQYQMPI